MRKSKLFIAVTMIAIISLFVVTGCTEAELGFWQLNKKINSIDDTLVTGNTYLRINTIGEEIPAEYAKTFAMLKDLNIKYRLTNSQKPLKQNLELEYKTGHSDYQPLTNIRFVDGYYYIQVKPLLNFAEEYIPALESDINEAKMLLQDIDYIKVKLPEQQLDYYKSQELTRYALDLFNNLKGVLNKYETTLISQEGDTYILEIDLESFFKSLKEFAEYTLENSDGILEVMQNTVDTTDEDTLGLILGMPKEDVNKEEIKFTLEALKENININKDILKMQIDQAYQMSEVLTQDIDNSLVRVEMIEKSDGKIGVKTKVDLTFTEPSGTAISIFSVDNADIQEVDDVIVTVPRGNILDLENFIQ